MTTFEQGEVSIRYDDMGGSGAAVLCLAPGGLAASRAELWGRAPWNPLEHLSDDYRLVAMDQRNTGTSFAPVTGDDGWHSYADDQLALMDHLDIDRFAVVGMCIGGAFILRLIEQAPERITAAVAMQPIGLDGNRPTFEALFDDWRAGVASAHPEAGDAEWQSFRSALFGHDRLVWSVDDALLPTIRQPMLVLQGDDDYHPRMVSQQLAAVVPSATLVERWKEPADLPAVDTAIREFIAAHAR